MIAGMIDRTWKERLDELMDAIIDLHPSFGNKYKDGMMAAYKLMQGNEDK
jgi:hypothetical protein